MIRIQVFFRNSIEQIRWSGFCCCFVVSLSLFWWWYYLLHSYVSEHSDCIYTKLCLFFSPLFFIDIFFKLIISIKLAIIHWIILDFLYGWFSGTPLYIYAIGVTGSISFLFHWMTPWVFCIVHYSHLIFRRLSAKKQLNVSYLQYSFYRSYLVENNQVLCWIICSS